MAAARLFQPALDGLGMRTAFSEVVEGGSIGLLVIIVGDKHYSDSDWTEQQRTIAIVIAAKFW